MGIEITNKAKIDLPNLAIEVVEELSRLNLKKEGNLKHTKELSELIKKDFTWRSDYSSIFSEAYLSAYSQIISKLPNENSKPYMMDIVKKLDSPSDLEKGELKNLISFCINLSDYAALHKEEVDNLKRPRF